MFEEEEWKGGEETASRVPQSGQVLYSLILTEKGKPIRILCLKTIWAPTH